MIVRRKCSQPPSSVDRNLGPMQIGNLDASEHTRASIAASCILASQGAQHVATAKQSLQSRVLKDGVNQYAMNVV